MTKDRDHAARVLSDALRQHLVEDGFPQRALEHAQQTGEPLLNTEALKADYEVIAFRAPFVVVKRKSDGKIGSFLFTHHPRWYFGWEEDRA